MSRLWRQQPILLSVGLDPGLDQIRLDSFNKPRGISKANDTPRAKLFCILLWFGGIFTFRHKLLLGTLWEFLKITVSVTGFLKVDRKCQVPNSQNFSSLFSRKGVSFSHNGETQVALHPQRYVTDAVAFFYSPFKVEMLVTTATLTQNSESCIMREACWEFTGSSLLRWLPLLPKLTLQIQHGYFRLSEFASFKIIYIYIYIYSIWWRFVICI